MYTDKQFQNISEELKDYITFFGYSNIGLDPKAQKENPTTECGNDVKKCKQQFALIARMIWQCGKTSAVV